MNKKGTAAMNPKILVLLVIILTLAGTVYYFGFYKANIISVCPGERGWGVTNYNPSTNQISIDFGTSSHNSAYYGVCYSNADVITSKDFCNSFFGSGAWNDESAKCNPEWNDDWFSNKQVISSTGTCTMTCTDSRGCGGVGLGPGASNNPQITPSFNGIIVGGLAQPYNSWTPVQCQGTIIVGLKEIPQQEEVIINPDTQSNSNPPSTTTDNTSVVPAHHWYDSIINFFKRLFRIK